MKKIFDINYLNTTTQANIKHCHMNIKHVFFFQFRPTKK